MTIKAAKVRSVSGFATSNIKVEVKHGATVIDTETITYSPKSAPILDLTNDSASIAYTNGGTKVNPGDPLDPSDIGDTVSTTAHIYVGGIETEADFT